VISGKTLKKRTILALTALLMLLAPYFVFACSAVFAQTQPPPSGPLLGQDNSGTDLSTGAQSTQPTTPNAPYQEPQTSLIQQMAEQDTTGVVTNVTNLLIGSNMGQPNEVYDGIKNFWNNDVISNLFSNIGQLIGRWIDELINGWVADAVQFLTAFLRTFVLNPNIAVNGLQNTPGGGNSNDDISPYIRAAADVMYGIAVDLLLLLFILCIWKFWVEASWRGGAGMMGAVGRLIATSGLMLAWPTIYAFEIQITNEMIKAIYFNSADQVVMLDAAMAAVIKGGLLATTGLVANAFAPVIGAVAGGALGGGAGGLVMGTVGDIVGFAGLIIYLILGGILIAELVYIIVLKAIQTALLTAQYMFAPIFLVFFATPDTENVATGFVRSFVEVSLWTFVWVGLLKIMVIIIFSQFNPWGKIVMAVGVLQLMIQVPSFLARAQISPMSDFISAGLLTKGLMNGFSALGYAAKTRTGQGFDYLMNQRYGARGTRQSNQVGMDMSNGVMNPTLLGSIQKTKDGKVQGGQGDKPPMGLDGKPIQPKKAETEDEKNKREAAEKAKGIQPANGTKTDVPGPKKKGEPTDPTAGGLGKSAREGTPLTTPKQGEQADPTAGGLGKSAGDGVKRAASLVGGAALAGGAAAAFGAAQKGGADEKQGEAEKQKRAREMAEAEARAAMSNADKLKTADDKAEDRAAKAEKAEKIVEGKLKTAESEKKKDEKKDATPLPPFAPGAKVPGDPTAGGLGKGAGTTDKPAESKLEVGKGDQKKGIVGGGTGTTGKDSSVELPGATPPDKKDKEKDGQSVAQQPQGHGLNTGDEDKEDKTGQNKGRLNIKINPPAGASFKKDQDGTPKVDNIPKPPVAGNAGDKPKLPENAVPTGGDNKGRPIAGGTENLGNIGGKGTVQLGLPGSKDSEATVDSRTDFDAKGNPVVVRIGGDKGIGQQRPGDAKVLPQGAQAVVPPGAQRPTVGDTHSTANAPQTGQTAAGGQHTLHTTGNGPEVTQTLNQQDQQGPARLTLLPGGAPRPAVASVTAARSNVTPIGIGTVAAMGAGALAGAAVAQGRSVDPTTSRVPQQLQSALTDAPVAGGDPPVSPGDPYSMYDQAGYRWVPGRGLAIDIRTAQGPTMGKMPHGRSSQLVGGGKGTAHVRFAEGTTAEQKALMVMAGGYANVFTGDVEAFDAARQSAIDAGEDGPKGMVENMAAGFMAYSGKSFKQTTAAKQRFQNNMYKHAAQGSQAYVQGQEGNAYTEYLEKRWGPMTSEQQAWGVHIFTDPSSPESGWSPKVVPATETLLGAGIPITASYRAAAANPAVLKQPAWGRGPAIRGVAAYTDAIADRMCGPDTHPFVRDALVGRLSPNVGAAEVGACLAIMQESPTSESGEATIKSNPALVQSVAQLVAGGHARDAVSAYRSVKGVSAQLANRSTVVQQDVIPGAGGSGGSGSISMPTSAQGFIPGAGAGVEVEQVMRSSGAQGGQAFVPPATGATAPQMARRVDVRFDPRTGSMPTLRQSVETNVSGQVIGEDVHMHGSMHPITQNIDVDARTRMHGTAPAARIPTNLPIGPQQIRQDIRVNIVQGDTNAGGTQRISTDVPVGAVVGQEQVTMSGSGSGSSGVANQTTQVDARSRGGSIPTGGGSGNAAASMAQTAAQRSAHNVHVAQQFIIDMHAAGFRDDQIQDPRIVQTALDVYNGEGGVSMLPTAAVVAGKLGPSDFTVQSVQVVEAMVDAGWNPNQISRPDIITADSILKNGGGYPTPRYVREVRQDQRYTPRPGAAPQVPSDIAARAARGEIDKIMRDLPF
jgi:hypothetical protein